MQRDVVERPRERRERTVRDVAGHVEHVGLAAGPGRDEPLREAAVVREQQQARRGLVEAADGAEPVERPSFFELCIVPRVPGRGFTIADVYSTGVEFQVRRGDGGLSRRALRCRHDPVKAPHVLTRARAAETPAAGRRRPTTPSRRAASRSRPACALHSSPLRRRADAAFKLVQRKVKVAPPRERLAPLLCGRLAVPRPRAPPGPRAPRDVAHLLRAQAGERREPPRRFLGRVRHEASLDSRVAQEVARVALCCLLASFFAAPQVVCEHC